MTQGITTKPRPHAHTAADLTAGTLADERIAASSVVQHQSLIDHGALAELAGDDHVQYAKSDGSRWTTTQTASRAVVSNGSGHLAAGEVTAAELAFLSGVSSAVQAQLDGKAASGHAHALDALSDVSAAAPSNGEFLKFNGTQWIAATGGGGATSLDELSDVTIASPQDGHILQRVGGTFVNVAAPFVSSDGISSPTSGQYLKYAGGVWTNAAIASADITFGDIATDTVTGTIVATTFGQKLGFWGATAVVQPAGADQAAVTLNNADNDFSSLAIGGTYDQSELQNLRNTCEELADDVRNMSVLLHAIRTALVSCGLMKGSA